VQAGSPRDEAGAMKREERERIRRRLEHSFEEELRSTGERGALLEGPTYHFALAYSKLLEPEGVYLFGFHPSWAEFLEAGSTAADTCPSCGQPYLVKKDLDSCKCLGCGHEWQQAKDPPRRGFYVMVCGGPERILAIPYEEWRPILPTLSRKGGPQGHWIAKVADAGSSIRLERPRGGGRLDLTQYLV